RTPPPCRRRTSWPARTPASRPYDSRGQPAAIELPGAPPEPFTASFDVAAPQWTAAPSTKGVGRPHERRNESRHDPAGPRGGARVVPGPVGSRLPLLGRLHVDGGLVRRRARAGRPERLRPP